MAAGQEPKTVKAGATMQKGASVETLVAQGAASGGAAARGGVVGRTVREAAREVVRAGGAATESAVMGDRLMGDAAVGGAATRSVVMGDQMSRGAERAGVLAGGLAPKGGGTTMQGMVVDSVLAAGTGAVGLETGLEDMV